MRDKHVSNPWQTVGIVTFYTSDLPACLSAHYQAQLHNVLMPQFGYLPLTFRPDSGSFCCILMTNIVIACMQVANLVCLRVLKHALH